MRPLFVLLRLIVALAAIVAVGVNFVDSYLFWRDAHFRDIATLVTNFFSYLTILCISSSALMLLIGAILLAAGRIPEPRWFGFTRATLVGYMVIVGTVYNLLLRNVNVSAAGEAPQWTNEVMHVAVPLYLVLDWFLAPGRRRMPWRLIGYTLLFPALWLVYTLVRAPLVYDQLRHVQGWYPYPFLDPADSALGWFSVAAHIVALAVVFSGVAAITCAISRWPLRRRGRRRHRAGQALAAEADAS